MKIFANIPGALKMLGCLRHLSENKKVIEQARSEGDFETERKWILKSTSSWGPQVLEKFGSKLNVRGYENLPDKGPVVLVGNHQGYADIFAYCAAFRKFQFAFVAKEELFKIPLYGKWIARIRSVFIERDDPEGFSQSHKGRYLLYRRWIFPCNIPGRNKEQGPCARSVSERSAQTGDKTGSPDNPGILKRKL